MFKRFVIIALVGAFLVGGSVAAIATKPTPAPKAEAAAETKSDIAPEEKLPIPRFVTLGTDEVNVRTGPGLRYPIKVIIRKDGLPVEIIREFDVWRQIRDVDGDEGWVHKSMLSGKRTVIIKGAVQALLKKPASDAKPVARLEPGVIADLEKCAGQWCYIDVASYDGWMKRENLWGVYASEIFKE